MRNRLMTAALTVLTVLAVAYVVILGLLWRFQERIVFQPPDEATPYGASTTRSLISYSSRDGIRLVAHVIESPDPAGPLVLAFHGNAMISRWMLPWAQELSRRYGATVVVPEYRGYDGLEGVPTYEGAGADAAAALDAAVARFGRPHSDIVYYGHSLGTAIATELAARRPPRSLLLESPFTSARDMAGRYPVVGLRFVWPAISRVHYDTRRHVGVLDVPVHVAHGEKDFIIPARMGREVHAAARRPGRLLLLPEAGHNDVADVGGEEYWRWIGGALASGPR